MTVRTPPIFLQAGSHPSENVRQMIAALSGTTGVIKPADLLVTAHGTPNMSVDVAVGSAFIAGTEATFQGAYYFLNDAVVNLVIAAADPTNPRNDLIVARIRDTAYSGANDDAALVVVPGTPAGSPVDPTTPANSLVLARVRVNALASSIVAGNVTDLRAFSSAWTAPCGTLPGGYVPRTTSQVSITTLTDLTGLTATVTVGAGRRIRVSCGVLFQSNTANDIGQVEIHEGTQRLQVGATTLPGVGQNYSISAAVILTPTAGSHTYKLQAQRVLGTSQMTLTAAADIPSYILVEDIGV